jgi:hypothetical protein
VLKEIKALATKKKIFFLIWQAWLAASMRSTEEQYVCNNL